MSDKKRFSDKPIFGIFIFLGVCFVIVFISIPSLERSINEVEVFSLNFVNGIFIGWADNIWALTYDNPAQASAAYKNVILIGESEHPKATLWGNLIGSFLSFGGVAAVIYAANAPTFAKAFSYGFYAEITEAIAWHVGYTTTTGVSALSGVEVVITLIIAVIMGFAAQGNYKRASSKPQRA